MKRLLTILTVFFLISSLFMLSCANRESTEAVPPNIVIIFADDMGYGDPGCYGGSNPTPHIDQMASEGIRLTDFYVAQPVCGASRAALLTGCYPNRVGIYGAPGPRSTIGINEAEVTIAELLKQKNYATAMFGKWHLGHRKPFLPVHHGFDEYFGTPYSNDMWPKHPDYAIHPKEVAERKWGFPPLPLIEHDTIAIAEVTGEHQAQFTTMFTERSVAFIKEHRDEPFFLYLAHPMPHVPLFASEKHLDKSMKGLYADVIMEIDWSVGRINHVLDSLGLADNTLVIFTSDNGPWLSYGNHAGSSGPLREGKGTTFDGGVREPCVMKWPGKLPVGKIIKEPVMTIDILPTVAHVTGTRLPDHTIDGENVWSVLLGENNGNHPQEAYYFYWGHNLEAVRAGDWKMHYPHKYRTMKGSTPGNDGMPGPYNQDSVGFVLYNLAEDIGETKDQSESHPEILQQLIALGDSVKIELGQGKTAGKGAREVGRWKEGS